MEQTKYRQVQLSGKNYLLLEISRDENGDVILELELNERITKLRHNISKCGSYEKLLQIGGEATRKYILRTKNMLRCYLHLMQVQYLFTTMEDVMESIKDVNACSLEPLVQNSSWEEIQAVAQEMRNSFIEQMYERRARNSNMPLKTAVA